MSETLAPPKFDFSGCSIKSDEDMAAALAGEKKKEGKFFDCGQHDVIIQGAKYAGLAPKDASWYKLELSFKGTGTREGKAWVMFPTKEVAYGPDRLWKPFLKCQQLASALGEDLKASTLKPVCAKLFGKPEKLVGKPLTIRFDYENARAKFVSKENGKLQIALQLNNKGELYQENSQVKYFDSYDAVKAFAKEKNIRYDSFPQPVEFLPASGDSGAPAWLSE